MFYLTLTLLMRSKQFLICIVLQAVEKLLRGIGSTSTKCDHQLAFCEVSVRKKSQKKGLKLVGTLDMEAEKKFPRVYL